MRFFFIFFINKKNKVYYTQGQSKGKDTKALTLEVPTIEMSHIQTKNVSYIKICYMSRL